MKKCSVCGETKPVADYYQQNGKPMKRCRDCQKSYARQWAVLTRTQILKTREKYVNHDYRTTKAHVRKNHNASSDRTNAHSESSA